MKPPVPYVSPARRAAGELAEALVTQGIFTDVHDGYDLTLVSVCIGLVIWCDGERFWWRTGWDERRRRAVYVWHPVADVGGAARRIVSRYAAVVRTASAL